MSAARRISAAAVVLIAGALGAACSSEGGSGAGNGGAGDAGAADAAPSGGAAVGGTVTLPADATGRCIMIALDDDTTGSNGSARRGDGSYLMTVQLVAGRTVKFSFENVPSGAYFLWAYVDANASASRPPGDCEIQGAPDSGDQLGYYETGASPPATANVRVPEVASAYDFQLGVVP